MRWDQDNSEPGPALGGLGPDGGGIEARLLGERAAAAVALERAHGQVVDVKKAPAYGQSFENEAARSAQNPVQSPLGARCSETKHYIDLTNLDSKPQGDWHRCR